VYLKIRGWDRQSDFKDRPLEQRAARFLYLNLYGFNGIYRVNSRGYYNVPFGGSSGEKPLNLDNLRCVSNFLGGDEPPDRRTITFSHEDYKTCLDTLLRQKVPPKEGAFVYLDPPYHWESAKSFVSYNKNGFTEEQQLELIDYAHKLSKLGVRVLMSNGNTQMIRSEVTRMGFEYREVAVRRSVAGLAKSRGMDTELAIFNYPV
jgi:DNA adenine methylase